MRILVTNDDGIFAQGLLTLVKELKNIAQVVVVAPDREQSATGTAVTLRQPLRVQRVSHLMPEVEAYSIDGTPSDSVILGLGKLVKNKIDLVISGINQGLNLGDDVLISGTVGAALQAYLRGLPALAISVAFDTLHFDSAAKLAALLARKIDTSVLPTDVFLNINMPKLPLVKIKGIRTARLANRSHINTAEERHDGIHEYYWLVRHGINKNSDKKTDIWAIEQGNISITPLHAVLSNRSLPHITDIFCSDLFQELKQQGSP